MENPFLQRASERYVDNEAFLAIVSPEPLRYYVSKKKKQLYDRLVLVRGTPGSGKTTLARLFEFSTLATLLRDINLEQNKPLVAALNECLAIRNERPCILACRLPLETDYREFWDFPYPEILKNSLMTALLQARAVLAWGRQLQAGGVDLQNAALIPRRDADAAVTAIGGTELSPVIARARAVETSLYRIVTALVPPAIESLDATATDAYRPFDVIDEFLIRGWKGGEELHLKPLAVFDDAHELHPAQLHHLERWLLRREVKVARWVLSRLDLMQPEDALALASRLDTSDALPGVTQGRECISILLQTGDRRRREHRVTFRKMARDMADRYLLQMPLFGQRNLVVFENLLTGVPERLAPTKQKSLASNVQSIIAEAQISERTIQGVKNQIETYLADVEANEDFAMAMLRVFLGRHITRRSRQRPLFVEEDRRPAKPLKIDAAIHDAGRIYLLHKYDVPYFYGMDSVCDASSENVEQFLHLAASLVEASAYQLIRGRSPALSAEEQNQLLRQKANEIIDKWSFPHCRLVLKLTTRMADRCLAESLLPNAPLGAGANAYGIPQQEFERLSESQPQLAQVLKYAVAYNAITLVPRYKCKGIVWCLLELGGLLLLKHGLPLKRGGFIESTAGDMAAIVTEEQPHGA